MKVIQLTQNKVALVDDDMFEILNHYKWHVVRDRKWLYATRKSKGKRIMMHHEVVGRPPNGLVTDHWDGNGFNNQRSNLRIVTNRENGSNRADKRDGKTSSKYVGVCFDRGKWNAYIKIDGQQKHLGRFLNENEAHLAYETALRRI